MSVSGDSDGEIDDIDDIKEVKLDEINDDVDDIEDGNDDVDIDDIEDDIDDNGELKVKDITDIVNTGLGIQSSLDIPSILSAQLPELSLSDDESDDEDSDSFKKFDSELKDKYLENIHPESYTQNYDEIASLSKVVRDSNGEIIDKLHQTMPWLTKYEETRVIGQRIKQLNTGAEPFVNDSANILDNSIIAKMELEMKKLPFIIRRPLPGGGSEFWKLKDLLLIN